MDNTNDSAYSSDTNDSNYAKPHLKNYIDTFRGHNTDTDLTSKVLSLEQLSQHSDTQTLIRVVTSFVVGWH